MWKSLNEWFSVSPNIVSIIATLSAVLTPIIYKSQENWRFSGGYFELKICWAGILINSSISTYFSYLKGCQGTKTSKMGVGTEWSHHFVLKAVLKWKFSKMWSTDLKNHVDWFQRLFFWVELRTTHRAVSKL